MRKLIPAAAIAAACLAIGACSSGASSSPAAAAPAVTASRAAKPSGQAACLKRPWSSGDLIVRSAEPGTRAVATEIGGEWDWDYSGGGRCESAMDFTVETAGTADGECTTIGYVKDNPGYDVNEVPAPPIGDVAAQAGPGCQ
jgi:hypothetical protein